ncbi:CpaF family protein [Piscinibacter sp. Jin2]|uniref:CpaF family protein n=1 Tax=Aquariibacter lacus TaxID=2801332 RepID=A0A9X0XCC6_9BURK|nr:CpaF family protein [Piscinibacter lacus]MBL0719245.1 CpaF family protein [Piscinibacter lacus]
MSTPDPATLSLREQLRRSASGGSDFLGERLRSLAVAQKDGRLGSESAGPLGLSPGTASYVQVRHRLHRGLLEVLNPQAVAQAGMAQIQEAINAYLDDALARETLPLSRPEREQISEDLLYEVIGLGPLSSLMSDPTVADILVNGPHQVYVERHGLLELTDIRFHDNEHLMLTIERILSRVGRRVDESQPMADARLPDGSRVNVIVPPIAVHGPSMSIRRFMREVYGMDELVAGGSLTARAAEFLKLAVRARLNIIVSGGTGSGKTTMLNCLSNHIPDGERIVTIEDTAELRLNHRHIVTLEARPANAEGRGSVSIRDIVKNALRMRPDRIIVGEVRGGEALDMLQAMNTGHDGSLATLHSNTPRDTLARLETMMLMADVDLPQRVLREQVGSALHLIVHLGRMADGSRRVTHITEVVDVDNGTILTQDLFLTRREGETQVMRGQGMLPACANAFHERNVALDPALFMA